MSKPKTTRRIINLILVLCLLACASLGYVVYRESRPYTYITAHYEESPADLDHPYTGFYHLYQYALRDCDCDTAVEEFSDMLEDDEESFLLVEFNLANYREGAITEAGLSNLDAILSYLAETDHQLILRFCYDTVGQAYETEPEELAIVEDHIASVAEVVNPYKGIVYLVQGNFTGDYGELHDSRYSNDQDLVTLMNDMDDAFAEEIYLAVRTPDQWRTVTGITGSLSKAQLTVNPLAARLSLFNDGLLADITDAGTFEEEDREEAYAFQELLSRYLPDGGETFGVCSYNDFEAACQAFATLHISYLDAFYDTAVLEKWEASLYTEEGVFSGMDGYNYMDRHMDYRYLLTASSWTQSGIFTKSGQLTLTLTNTGFATCYLDAAANLLIYDDSGALVDEIALDYDLRDLAYGETEELNVLISLSRYDLSDASELVFYLGLSDTASGRSLRLANVTDPDDYDCYVGTLVLTED